VEISLEQQNEELSGMIEGVVDANTTVFVSVTEGLDLNQEIRKLQKLVDSGEKWISGIRQKMEKPG